MSRTSEASTFHTPRHVRHGFVPVHCSRQLPPNTEALHSSVAALHFASSAVFPSPRRHSRWRVRASSHASLHLARENVLVLAPPGIDLIGQRADCAPPRWLFERRIHNTDLIQSWLPLEPHPHQPLFRTCLTLDLFFRNALLKPAQEHGTHRLHLAVGRDES